MPKVTFQVDSEPPKSGEGGDNVELFHGIGNTLGFNITGGSDFSMPITIFHVKEGSRAESAGLKLGDAIVTINRHDTSEMTLQEANAMLEQSQQNNLKLGVIKFDEVDDANPEKKPKVHNIVLEGKRGNPRLPFEDELRPPREACVDKEKPHLRIIRNLRKLLADVADKPQEREAHLEQLLLILPRGSADPLEVIRPKVEPNPEDIIDEEDVAAN